MSTRADVALETADNPNAKINAKNLIALAQNIEGRVLTIAEASIDDKVRLEATKSLLREAIWTSINIVSRWMLQQDSKNGSTFPL